MKSELFPKDYHTFWKLSRHWGAFCFHRCQEVVVLSQGLPHNLQAYCFMGRLLLSSMSWSCNYSQRITTQFASLLFYEVLLAAANLTKLSWSRKDYHIFWKLSLQWSTFCSDEVHDVDHHTFCKLTVHCAALVVINVAKYVVILSALLFKTQKLLRIFVFGFLSRVNSCPCWSQKWPLQI